MKFLLVSSLLVVAVATAPNLRAVPFRDSVNLTPRIISGTPAVKGQFPWQASNTFATSGGTYFCGGSLITNGWVLTAAHCVDGANQFVIVLGSLRASFANEVGSVVIVTNRAIIHENYNSARIVNDVGLIDLKQNVGLSAYIQTISLGTTFIGGSVSVTVSGWGKTSDSSNSISPVLNYASVTTISNADCKRLYGNTVTNGTLCCVGTHSSCNGDSGGPLVQYDQNGHAFQVGIVSFGPSIGCSTGLPAGYSRVQFYQSWILNSITK